MAKIIIRRSMNGITPIDPVTFAWDTFWRDYSGTPWEGTVTAGDSGLRLATEVTNYPAIGVAQNGHYPADFDGINDQLEIGAASNVMTDGYWCGYAIIEADEALARNIVEPYYEPGIVCDNSGSIGLTFTDQGIGLFRFTNSVGWKAVRASVDLNKKVMITWEWNANENALKVGVNGPPNHTQFCIPIDISVSLRTLFIGRNCTGSHRFNGKIYEHAMRKLPLSNNEYNAIVASTNIRYGLTLSQPSNFQIGKYNGINSPAYSYAGTTKTAAASWEARDGAKLHFFAGKYRLLGGWRSAPIWPGDPSSLTTNQIWSSTDLVNWTLDHEHDPAAPISGVGARWLPRHAFGSVELDGYLYVIGSDQYLSGKTDVWRTDGSNECGVWERVCAEMPSGFRTGYCVGVYDGNIHALGGHPIEASTFYAAQKSHHFSSDGGVTWKQLPDLPFSTAYQTTLIEHDGLLFSIGGNAGNIYGGTRIPTNSVWAWNGSKWRKQCDSAPWPARYWNDCIVYDDKLWVLAGRINDAEDIADAWYSRDAGQTWTEVTVPWPTTHADGVCATEADGIVMATGFGTNKSVYTLKKV